MGLESGNVKDIGKPCKITIAGKEVSGISLEHDILRKRILEFYGITIGDTVALFELNYDDEKQAAVKQKLKMILDTLRPAKK